MLKKLRKNQKGFTLAELLIVVAIIGVLVAVSIPIFTSQLRKARIATNEANARAAMAAAVAAYLEDDSARSGTYDVKTGTYKPASATENVTALESVDYGAAGQTISQFVALYVPGNDGEEDSFSITPKNSGAGGSYNVDGTGSGEGGTGSGEGSGD